MNKHENEKSSEIEHLAMLYICGVLNSNAYHLQEKSNRRFCQKENTPGYIVVPKDKEWMLDLKNRYGFSVRNYCFGAWPKMSITNPSDIDIVWEEGEWKQKKLPDNTWAIIDTKGYGDPKCGEDSFELFTIE